MYIQSSHLFFIREILNKGLLRHSKHVEHYDAKQNKTKKPKKTRSLSLQSSQCRGRNGYFSSSHISKFETVAITTWHVVLM